MKLKLAYHRASGTLVDIAVTADVTATVADIAEEVLLADPLATAPASAGGLTLSVAPPGSATFAPLDGSRSIGESRVTSGYSVRVVPAETSGHATRAKPRVHLEIGGGRTDGGVVPLVPGTYYLGRGPANDIILTDPMVSKVHARLEVSDLVEMVDINSANGIEVDGDLVSRLFIRDGQSVVVGDTTIRFRVEERSTATDLREMPRIQGAVIQHNRPPRVEPRYAGREYPGPELPGEHDKPLFPWLLMIVPVVLGATIYVFTRSPLSLVFVAMSPMMMLANYMMGRKRVKRQRDTAVSRFESQFSALEQALVEQIPVERATRERETPRCAEVAAAVESRDDLLWTRRPEHWSFLSVRLGTGTTPSRNSVVADEHGQGLPEFGARVDELISRYRLIGDTPVVENPLVSGALGVVGPIGCASDVARGLLLQWFGLHAPTELVMVALTSSQLAPEFEFLKWLPHSSSAHSPIVGAHLADSAATGQRLLAQLEQVVSDRLAGREKPDELRPALEEDLRATSAGARAGSDPDGAVDPPLLPAIVLLVTHDAPVDQGRLIQLVERAISVGIVPLFMAPAPADLPGACRTFVDVRPGSDRAAVHFVRHGAILHDVRTEGIDREQALRYARRLSGVADAGAVIADESDLPTSVPLLSLLGQDMTGPAAVVDRWRQNFSLRDDATRGRLKRTPTLRSLVGVAGADALHLDLRSQGPHALVGGTTGAGKSEFLQSWVLGMAGEYSPQRVTFLFVDYKGGAAFADCVDLPHSVGLVTDLSPHLVRRALVSLRAELRYRERILNARKAKDLLELEKRGDPEAPPALVLVIDEFAALVGEVPEFVDGVVDVAQRGRSLGIHLIMATQRPTGVIRDNLRANTNLRIALRMADEADSSDVVGTSAAAAFDPAIPGRALAKAGPGRLVAFQSAYAGGWSDVEDARPAVWIHDLRFGAETRWERPEAPEQDDVDPGPTDQARLVTAMSDAARMAQVPPPRRPWLDELGTTYDLADMSGSSDADIALGIADLPELQDQAPVTFRPDVDGHLIIYGTGGSGKSAILRTLAAASGWTPDGGPVDVYGLDFASGGLRMLEDLPHVGSIIPGEESERVIRLLRRLKSELDRRGREYPRMRAGSITEYRQLAHEPDEPRILLLLDGFATFRAEYEGVAGRAAWYAGFQQLLTEGRQLGIHVVMTADRPGSVPGAVASSVPRRIVLRLAEDTMYTVLGVGAGILGPESPPGRAVVDGNEVQMAVVGGSSNSADQAERLEQIAARLTAAGRRPAPPIEALPDAVPLSTLPLAVDGQPTLGLSDVDLQPIGVAAQGVLLVGGGPSSGRSNALLLLTRSVHRCDPAMPMHYLGGRRTSLVLDDAWQSVAVGPDEAVESARALSAALAAGEVDRSVTIVIESLSDFQGTAAADALVELVKTAKRTGQFVVAESETSTWGSSFPLFTEIKAARRGLLLQPDPLEGETLLRTGLPRAARSEFPPGRGYLIQNGKAVRIQLALGAE